MVENWHAGIYWPPKPRAAFHALSEEDQALLADFMEVQRLELEVSGGGEKEGLAAVWKTGWAVAWDIRLKPQLRKPRRGPRMAPQTATLGSNYRIEVLEVWKLS